MAYMSWNCCSKGASHEPEVPLTHLSTPIFFQTTESEGPEVGMCV